MKPLDDKDSLSVSAVAALSVAVGAAKRIKDDSGLAAWVAELENLPVWRDSPAEWLQQLARMRHPYKLPSPDALATRTDAQRALNRVCLHVEGAANPNTGTATRHRELVTAGIFSGLLGGLAYANESEQQAIQDAVDAAFVLTGSRGGKKGNESRNKLKGDAFAFLTQTFPEIPLHRKGAPKGKPDAPKLAAALHKNPATSHLPGKTRSDWAKEWAKAREASQ